MNPGADTVRQMPGFCVMKPAIEAAYPAFCSWRKEITRSPAACNLRVRSVIGMPGRPKIVSMPFSLRASMTSAKPSVSRAGALLSPETALVSRVFALRASSTDVVGGVLVAASVMATSSLVGSAGLR